MVNGYFTQSAISERGRPNTFFLWQYLLPASLLSKSTLSKHLAKRNDLWKELLANEKFYFFQLVALSEVRNHFALFFLFSLLRSFASFLLLELLCYSSHGYRLFTKHSPDARMIKGNSLFLLKTLRLSFKTLTVSSTRPSQFTLP